MKDIQFEGVKMTDEKKAYRHIKNRMDFPDDLSMNLDVLWDKLTALSQPTCVTLNDSTDFKANCGQFAYDVIDIFEKASKINTDLAFECY